jgi:hypothetical protein
VLSSLVWLTFAVPLVPLYRQAEKKEAGKPIEMTKRIIAESTKNELKYRNEWKLNRWKTNENNKTNQS